MDPEFQLPPEFSAELEEFLRRMPFLGDVRSTCAGAVRMAELRAQNPAVVPDLPDLYEPLVLFYERGGEFFRDHAGFLDLTGVLFRPGTLRGHLGTTPLTALSDVVLDALDAEGHISFYAVTYGQGLLLRRRELRDEQRDELFSQNLCWEPTNLLPASEKEAEEAGWVRISDLEAVRLIEATVVGTAP
ncbi:hypothetical protein ACWC2K_02240 [Streptomyces chattanoogensis]